MAGEAGAGPHTERSDAGRHGPIGVARMPYDRHAAARPEIEPRRADLLFRSMMGARRRERLVWIGVVCVGAAAAACGVIADQNGGGRNPARDLGSQAPSDAPGDEATAGANGAAAESPAGGSPPRAHPRREGEGRDDAPASETARAEAASKPGEHGAPDEPEPAPGEPRPRFLSPLTPEVVSHLREIASRVPNRSDDVFAKVGDSATVNRGFIQCFADPESVRLVHCPREDLEIAGDLPR